MGKTAVSKDKAPTKRQSPLKVGTTVYFFGFTKSKKFGPQHYVCKGRITESPSAFSKAPHRVKISSVALSKFHRQGSEEDGRTLLDKEIYMPIAKLNPELQPWLAPTNWWI